MSADYFNSCPSHRPASPDDSVFLGLKAISVSKTILEIMNFPD